MSGLEEDRLSHFQVEIAALFFDLPESVGFLLAGGGALIAQGLVHRDTDDLDFFATRANGDVAAADAALTTAARHRGWIVEVIRTGTEFRRLRIGRDARDSEDEVFVDLALDSPPIGAPTVTIAGRRSRPTSSRCARPSPCSAAPSRATHRCLHAAPALRQGRDPSGGCPR